MVRALFGTFAAIQTYVVLARQDRFALLFSFTRETWPYVLLLWLKDLGLAVAAGWAAARLLALVVRAAAREETAPPEPPSPQTQVALVLSALGLGAFLRWIFHAWNPPGLWVDTVWLARPALADPALPLWGVSVFGEDPASHEVVSNLASKAAAAVLALFGGGETGWFALAALPGTLVLPALWWCAHEAYGPRAAAWAAFAGALLAWPLLLSRWAATANALLALALLGGAAALAAVRTSSVSFALLSGAAVGLSLHTHASAGAVAAGFGLFALLAARARPARRLVAAAAAAAALAAAPLAWGFVFGPGRVGGHLRDVHLATPVKAADAPRAPGIGRVPWALASNALDYSGLLLFTRDPNVRHAPPGGAVFTPLAGAAALLGFGLASSRRRPGDVLLLCVSAGALLAGILSNPGGAPNTLRACALAGPAVILAALLAELGATRAARTGLARASVLAVGLAAAAFTAEAVPVLAEFPDGAAAAFCPTETSAGRLLSRLRGDAFLETGAVPRAAVVEALAPVVRKTAAALAAAPPRGPFWFLGSPRDFDALRAAGFSCAHGVGPSEVRTDLVLARVLPPRRP